MEKKLYLMPKGQLSEYLGASKELLSLAKGMSAADVKANSEYILESAGVNEIDRDGNVKFPIQDGVAHIPITGMLTNSVDPCSGFFGESITTYDFITESIQSAESNQSIKEIVLEIDSGGGDVNGVEAASNAIFNAKKPTTSRVHSMAASAAYWLGSQTDKIVAIGRTSGAGSIGVAAEFVDRSAEDKANGRERIILTSTDAPQKRLDIKTEEAQVVVIERMDDIHTVFTDHIIRGRAKAGHNLTREFINENFGKGSTMGAEKAIASKMIDSIENQQVNSINAGGQMIAKTTDSTQLQAGNNPVITPAKTAKREEKNMNLAEFLKENPTAQTEVDEMVASAVSGKMETFKATNEKVIPIVSSEAYGAAIKNAGFKVMNGEKSWSSFEDMVALSDEMNQKAKSDQIKEIQPPETPAQATLDEKESKKAKISSDAQALGKKLGVA